jgi:hypothetical protein
VQNNDQRTDLRNSIIITGILVVCIIFLLFTDFGKGRVVVYDCRDAHWHPDVPIDVKRECSKLMYEEWKRQRDERKNDPGLHEDRPNLFTT